MTTSIPLGGPHNSLDHPGGTPDLSRPFPAFMEGLLTPPLWEGLPIPTVSPGGPPNPPDHSGGSPDLSRPLPAFREDSRPLPILWEGLTTPPGPPRGTPDPSRTFGRVYQPHPPSGWPPDPSRPSGRAPDLSWPSRRTIQLLKALREAHLIPPNPSQPSKWAS